MTDPSSAVGGRIARGPLADADPTPHVGSVISYVFVDGFTRVPRDEAIERLKRVIADADGVIVDFAFFGGQAIRLTVELDAGSFAAFRRGLAGAEIELFPRCIADIDAVNGMAPSHPLHAMLHVAFVPADARLPTETAHAR